MFFFDHDGRGLGQRDFTTSKGVQDGRRRVWQFYQLDETERLQTDVPSVWKHPIGNGIIKDLTELSFFKCPFCEQLGQELQIHRFRPPAYVTPHKEPEDRYSYFWLTFAWKNLFPICKDCLPDDKSYFPVKGRRVKPEPYDLQLLRSETFNPEEFSGIRPIFDENAVLYYPGELEHPYTAFNARLDGMLVAKNERAAATIDQFHLNRMNLASDRHESFEAPAEQYRWFGDGLENQEFGGYKYLLLRRLAEKLAVNLGRPKSLSFNAIQAVFDGWRRHENYSDEIHQAFDEMRTEDQAEPTGFPAVLTKYIQEPPLTYPRLKSVKIRHFKSLENIEILLPKNIRANTHETDRNTDAPCLLILGENATGKSSILEAITLSCIPESLRRKLDQKAYKLTLNPKYMGDPNRPLFEDSCVELKFHNDQQIDLDINVAKKKITSSGFGGPLPLVFAYGAHRLYGETRRRGDIRKIDTLFGNNKQISNPEKWLIGLHKSHPDALNEVAAALRNVIQIEGDFTHIDVDESGCFINVKKAKPDETEYILRQHLHIASSGYKAMLALICDVFEGLLVAANMEPRVARLAHAIVLIDEIEAHLHPRWKIEIIAGLRKAFPNVTYIITSHDPLCVRGMRAGEVMVLNRYLNDDASGLPEVVEKVTELGDVENLTIQQLLTSDLFQLLYTDGETDKTIAKIADILTIRHAGGDLTVSEQNEIDKFNAEIADGLPYGRSEVTRLVQEAVAEYLKTRRYEGARMQHGAREKAKEEVKKYLEGLLK